jgi:hypothetical protein
MIGLSRLRVIAEAKFSDKSNLGDWYRKRLEICGICPYNSKNKENLTIRDKAVVGMNLGKDSCLACTCEIDAKASVRDETCGLAKIGKDPLWKPLPSIDKADFNDMHIENLSADKVTMKVTNQVLLDYGTIKYKSDSNIEISVKDKSLEIQHVGTRSSCGCTVATPTRVGDTYFVKISYDTKRVGNFEKTISIILTTEDKKTKQINVRIIGTVIN